MRSKRLVSGAVLAAVLAAIAGRRVHRRRQGTQRLPSPQPATRRTAPVVTATPEPAVTPELTVVPVIPEPNLEADSGPVHGVDYPDPDPAPRRSRAGWLAAALVAFLLAVYLIGIAFGGDDGTGLDRDQAIITGEAVTTISGPATTTTVLTTSTTVPTTTTTVLTTTSAAPATTTAPPTPSTIPSAPTRPATGGERSDGVFYANCDEARLEGSAPLFFGDPGYRPELDPEGDGITCD